ncbi:hypothetical protein HZH66_001228 [Vespula vulgaris]|uniref:Uncharacterized protein n=1 Tax=Vespula vulgaris TaxID=7454 RepID=A0A834KUN3_VESVU|nr:hypothetical protein HZH66_001228 [Vespula vulgaris]
MAYSACLRTQPNSSSHTKGPCCYGAAELSQGCDNLCWSRSTSDNIVWIYVEPMYSREEKEEEEEEEKEEEEEEEEEETSGQLPQSFAELLKSRGE